MRSITIFNKVFSILGIISVLTLFTPPLTFAAEPGTCGFELRGGLYLPTQNNCNTGFTAQWSMPNCTCVSTAVPGTCSVAEGERGRVTVDECKSGFYANSDLTAGSCKCDAVNSREAPANAVNCDPADPSKPDSRGDGVRTAIGCIPTDPKQFVRAFLKFAFGAAGGIALLLMVIGAIRIIASAGNPEMVKKGQDQFTAAIIGLLFVIFSVLLLQIIGVDILGLPGFL